MDNPTIILIKSPTSTARIPLIISSPPSQPSHPLNSCSTVLASSSVFSPDLGELLLGVALITKHAQREAEVINTQADVSLSAFDESKVSRSSSLLNPPTVAELVSFLHRTIRIIRAPPEAIVLSSVHFLRAVALSPPKKTHIRLLLLACIHLANKTHDDKAISTKDWPTVWAYAATGRLPSASPTNISVADISNAEAALLRLLNFRVGVARDTYVRVYFALRDAAKEASAGALTADVTRRPLRPLTAAGGRLICGSIESQQRDSLWDPRSPKGKTRSTASAVLSRVQIQGDPKSSSQPLLRQRSASCDRCIIRSVSRLVLS
jgi:hypothetical protein